MTGLRRLAPGAVGLAVAVLLAPDARATDAPAPEDDVCAPVEAGEPPLPDLQQLAYAVCRAVRGEGEPSVVSERLRLRVGGWADASYRDDDRDGGQSSVALNHLNFHADLRWAERWQLFAEGEYEHEPDLYFPDERDWELEQLWGQYAASDLLRLRLGRFGTRFGYWTPVHWSILVDTIEEPIHETNRIVPEQQIGAELSGSWFAGALGGVESELEYAAYAGYAEDGFDTGKAVGLTLGGDLRLRLQERYLLGVSLYTQKNGEEDDRRERDVVLYSELHLPLRLLARAEYVYQHRSGRTRPVFERDVDIFYAKLRWDFLPGAYLNYRFEVGDDDRFGQTAQHLVNRVTLGYRPLASRIVLKAEYARHEFSSEGPEDSNFWGASAGVVF